MHMRRTIATGQSEEQDESARPNGPARVRFDAEGFYLAIDAERRSRRLTWKRVAEEAQVSASTLTRMAQGRRPDVDSLAALVAWSGLKADDFVREDQERRAPGSLAMVSTYLKTVPHLTPEQADALVQLVNATHKAMQEKDSSA